MFHLYRAAVAASAFIALVSLPVFAHTHHSDESTGTLPAADYVSAFKQYRPTPEDDASADQLWRDANLNVGKLGGHAGHIGSVTKADASNDHPASRKDHALDEGGRK